jgi:SAM-dependent methyltransferase
MPTGVIPSPTTSDPGRSIDGAPMLGDRRLVHLGCGPNCTPTAWIDYDGSWQAKILGYPGWIVWLPRLLYARLVKEPLSWPSHVRYMDLRRTLGFASDSIDAIYASHVLEHLYRDEARRLVAECYRALKPGGVLRLAVPNLRHYATEYLASTSPEAADEFVRLLFMRSEREVRNPLIRLYHLCGGDFHSHKWMYDPASLTALFLSAGFSDVSERPCRDSTIPEIEAVESPERVSRVDGFAVEGVKLV